MTPSEYGHGRARQRLTRFAFDWLQTMGGGATGYANASAEGYAPFTRYEGRLPCAWWRSVKWEADGVTICTTPGTWEWPKVVSDGAGGAIIAWDDFRGGYFGVYAQRVDADGVVRWV